METIFINEEGCKIHRAGDHLLVKKDGRKIMTVPLVGVRSIIVNTSVQFTTQALEMFLEKNIDVIFMNISGHIKGHLFSQKRSGVVVRMAQYDCYLDSSRRTEMARAIVRGKIFNQQSVVKKYRLPDAGDTFGKVINELSASLCGLEHAESIDEIMGYEGISARTYFESVRRMLKRDDFERREYRPAKDIVNSALNLGYAFLANEAEISVRAQKLDEELGFLHSIHYGRNSLALDMMEEFRAPFIDAWVIKMFNTGVMSDKNFHGIENKYLLNKEGYRKFCSEYSRHINDKFDWRRIITDQARKMRIAIMERGRYEPFEYC